MRKYSVLFLAGLVWTVAACGDAPSDSASSAALAPFVFENPLRDAEPEEWAEYRTLDGKTLRYTFKALDERTIFSTIQEEMRDPETNTLLSRQNLPIPPNHFLNGFDSAGAVVTRLSQEEIVVAGRRWNCLCVEYVGRLQGEFKCWYSNEVPVLGMVRQEKVRGGGDLRNLELLDWSGHRR